jgi:hypothetical protein
MLGLFHASGSAPRTTRAERTACYAPLLAIVTIAYWWRRRTEPPTAAG